MPRHHTKPFPGFFRGEEVVVIGSSHYERQNAVVVDVNEFLETVYVHTSSNVKGWLTYDQVVAIDACPNGTSLNTTPEE